MKKLLLTLLLIAFGCFNTYAGTLATGSVTRDNIRLSTASGKAFVDFSSAGALTNYIGCKVTITDSASKTLIGYIKAAGSGETLGEEALPNTAFSDTASVTAQYNAIISSVAGGQSGNALQVQFDGVPTVNARAREDATAVNGGAYKFTGYFKKGSAIDGAFYYGHTSTPNAYGFNTYTDAAWAQKTKYFTSAQTTCRITMLAEYSGNHANVYSLYDTLSLKQILTPSTTGVTIVTTSDGASYSWTSETSGFNRNDASGYTYAIEAAAQPMVVRRGGKTRFYNP